MFASKKFLAVAIVSAAVSAPALADTITAEGFVHSAPAVVTASTLSRAQVQADAVRAVRAQVADVIVAEGVGAAQPAAVAAQLSRDQVRAEAVRARDTLASAQVSEGLVHLF